jgi:hypothetical protein
MERKERPSVYLEEKCDTLRRALNFFGAAQAGFAQPRTERLMVFLTQIDFWEWEIDNLIYSFSTFAERAKAWEQQNGYGLANALRARGIPVRVGAVKDLKERRQARSDRVQRVVSPTKRLNEVITQWNQLLEISEGKVLVTPEERQRDIQLGAQFLPDLSRYRKALQEEAETKGGAVE